MQIKVKIGEVEISYEQEINADLYKTTVIEITNALADKARELHEGMYNDD